MKKVMILGAGTMGAGIAQVVAQAGCEVIVRDVEMQYVETVSYTHLGEVVKVYAQQ